MQRARPTPWNAWRDPRGACTFLWMKPLRCLLGMHAWRSLKDEDDGTKIIECARCGKHESRTPNVAVGSGWAGWRRDS